MSEEGIFSKEEVAPFFLKYKSVAANKVSVDLILYSVIIIASYSNIL